MITAGPTTAISSPRPPPRVESHPRPNRASLTAWNGEGDGKCDRDHRHRNTDQWRNTRVRQREGNGKRQRVRDAQEHNDLT
jgi:hypothetical protein